MTEDSQGIVFAITHIESGKVYVGLAMNGRGYMQRYLDGDTEWVKTPLRKDLRQDIERYGQDAFRFDVLETVDGPFPAVKTRWKSWLARYQRSLGLENVYNTTHVVRDPDDIPKPRITDKPMTVYGIKHGDQIHYVGQTAGNYRRRFNWHVWAARHLDHPISQPVHAWMASLDLQGVHIVVLAQTHDEVELGALENYWIEKLRSEGHPIKNRTRGGVVRNRGANRKAAHMEALAAGRKRSPYFGKNRTKMCRREVEPRMASTCENCGMQTRGWGIWSHKRVCKRKAAADLNTQSSASACNE